MKVYLSGLKMTFHVSMITMSTEIKEYKLINVPIDFFKCKKKFKPFIKSEMEQN